MLATYLERLIEDYLARYNPEDFLIVRSKNKPNITSSLGTLIKGFCECDGSDKKYRHPL